MTTESTSMLATIHTFSHSLSRLLSALLLLHIAIESPILFAQHSTEPTNTAERITHNSTEPFSPRTTTDALALLDRYAADGVAKDQNAAIDLLRILGPAFIRDFNDSERFWEKLATEPLDANQNYFVTESMYRSKLNKPAREQFSDEIYSVTLQDWSTKNNPLISGWLHENRKSLDQIEAAVSKPRFYLPVMFLSKNGNAAPLLDKEIDSIAETLQYRAYQKFTAKNINGAISDFLTTLKLARLVAQQPIANLERSTIRCEYIGLRGLIAMALSDELEESQLQQIRDKIAELQPLDAHRIFSTTKLRGEESLAFHHWTRDDSSIGLLINVRSLMIASALETTVKTERSKLQDICISSFDKTLDAITRTAHQALGTKIINLPQARRIHINLLHEYAFAYEQATLAESVRQLKEIELRLAKRIRDQYSFIRVLKLARSPLLFRNYSTERITLAEQYALHRMHTDKFMLMQNCRFDFHACEVACMLMLHREKHGRFPDSLNEIATDSQISNWIDPFSDEPIRFIKSPTGFTLYSVGVNRKDEHGEKNYLNGTDDWGIAFPYEDPK